MHRTLIVARLDTEDPGRIADIFGESDASELPGRNRPTTFSSAYMGWPASGPELGTTGAQKSTLWG